MWQVDDRVRLMALPGSVSYTITEVLADDWYRVRQDGVSSVVYRLHRNQLIAAPGPGSADAATSDYQEEAA